MKKLPNKPLIGFLFLTFFLTNGAFGQGISGRVVNDAGQGIHAASVRADDLGIQIHTNAEGIYYLNLGDHIPDRLVLRYSFLGMETVSLTVQLSRLDTLETVTLRPSSFAVDEVTVQAESGGQSNSSMIIDREMIERYPSLSLNDLLNFLPNRQVVAPSVQNMQNLNIRGAFQEMTGARRDVDQLNNAFGTAIIID
ncbi:MAG: carboxypeptidase-like regulatory domain-containing protein, partial [Sphingobacterium sp.]